MQGHGQQRNGQEYPFAERRPFDCPGCQQGKGKQIGQPPQQQRGGKAQMQHIAQQHRQPADQVQGIVRTGLQLIITNDLTQLFITSGIQLPQIFPPGKDGGVGILQQRVLVGGPAEGFLDGHRADGITVRRQVGGNTGGQGKRLVDVILFIRHRIRGQQHGEQQPERQHQHKAQPVQRPGPRPGNCRRAKTEQRGGQQAECPEIGRHKTADLLGNGQQRQTAGHRGIPQIQRSVQAVRAEAHRGLCAAIGIVGGQNQPVTFGSTCRYRRVQPHHGVSVRHKIGQITGADAQQFAGIVVVQFQMQRSGTGTLRPHLKAQAHQRPVGGKGLGQRLGKNKALVILIVQLDALALALGRQHCRKPYTSQYAQAQQRQEGDAQRPAIPLADRQNSVHPQDSP